MSNLEVEYQAQARRQQIVKLLKSELLPLTTYVIHAALKYSRSTLIAEILRRASPPAKISKTNDLNELSRVGQIIRIKQDNTSHYYWGINV